MNETNQKPATWFWVVSILALIWNIMGVMAYLGQAYMTDEAMAALPQEQQDLYAATPAWVTGAFAIAVFAGFIGCLALVLRKKWATPLLMLSLLGVIAQQIYNFGIAKMHTVMGSGSVIMSVFVLLISILLIAFARSSTAKGWLR